MTTLTLGPGEVEAWDRFAAAALAGGLAQYSYVETETAANYADAMILERRKRYPSPSIGPFPLSTVGHRCEKCGCDSVTVRYRKRHTEHEIGHNDPCPPRNMTNGEHDGEHHHVTCTRCGATWTEAVIGQEPRHG